MVANAYIGPKVRKLSLEISGHITRAGFGGAFLVVQSTGGLYEAEQAKSHCIRMLESGPAAGVIGTKALCRSLALDNAIAFDMGGTTAKAGVIHKGEPLTTSAALIGGYEQALPIQIAMMDIFEVGTGGGSIARARRRIAGGPQSAGAQPGPACYGLTAADRYRRQPRAWAHRRRSLPRRRNAARYRRGELLETRIAKPLGMSLTAAADGILRIAATAMSYAVKTVTTERGLDAGFVLVPMEAPDRSTPLSCPRIGIRQSSSRTRRGVLGLRHAAFRRATTTCAPGRLARRRVVRRRQRASI